MERRKRTLTSKLIGTASAFGLTFAMACATTTETDEMSPRTTKSDAVAAGETADPLGPPQHIDSEVTREHPSSNTGTGNYKGTGANTNLNQPAPEPTVTVTQSDAVITQTPIVERETVVVEREPVEVETPRERVVVETPAVEVEPQRTVQVQRPVEEGDEEVEIRRVTKKE